MDIFDRTTTVDAVFRHGVFQPLQPVNLAEDQLVQLNVAPTQVEAPREWLERVQQRQAEMLRRGGPLPDSAPEIAADRLR